MVTQVRFVQFLQIGHTYYYICDDGRVLSTSHPDTPISTWKEIASFNGKGYRRVRIARQNFKVHRLVAENFIPNPENRPYVLHIDGDRTNNHYTNLRWAATQSNYTRQPDPSLFD